MKRAFRLLGLTVLSASAFAQGSLTPSAAPAPTGRTLQQIEPRVDVSTLAGDATAVILINSPGSYYLTASVNATSGRAAIAISASNVTLDLNGFGVTGVSGSTRGLEIRDALAGVRIRNGTIGPVLGAPGLGATGASFVNVRIEQLSIRSCAQGILLPAVQGLVVEDVTVTNCNQSAIDLNGEGRVLRCSVESISSGSGAGTHGIRAGMVADCRVKFLTSLSAFAVGISASEVRGCSVNDVSGAASETAGIAATQVSGCQVATVTTSAGAVAGISLATSVNDCNVSGVGASGSGAPTGISAVNVIGCKVSNLSAPTNSGATVGISAPNGLVSQSAVFSFGAGSGTQNATGISARLVTQSSVSSGTCAASLSGILADEASQCSVDTLIQTGGSSTVGGITALRISDCSVNGIVGSGSNVVLGCSGYRLATECSVNGLSGNTPVYLQPLSLGQTLRCVAGGSGGVGVNGNAGGGVIRGCRISLGGSGTGIICAGSRNVVEDNAVSDCSTGINASNAASSGLIVRNRVTNCTGTNISAAASWQVGPVVNAVGTIASTSPWANFTD